MGWWARVRGIVVPERVELIDGPLPLPSAPSPFSSSSAGSVRPQLRRVAVEAVLRQDEAEAVLVRVRRRDPFGEIAHQAGPLVRRFFALRDELPAPCSDVDDERIRSTLDVVLHHDAMVLSVAMDLLACEWRSERIARQVDTFDGLGPPARLLEAVYAELAADDTTSVPVSEGSQLPR